MLTVSELTGYIKHLLESDAILRQVKVQGEISNLTYHSSGHVYFGLKDISAQIACTMFKTAAVQAPRLANGDKVIVSGEISVYPASGKYQLNVREVEKAGAGELYKEFLALKDKLNAEGLFAPERKKSIPKYPKFIVVISSPTGAAARDVMETICRRYPVVKILLLPTLVQGEMGGESIIRSLKIAETLSPDVVILARGGGSIEDLWNFNEEKVVRALAACSFPTLTGIGHEPDFTICDFVADMRASTPTAAAEKAVPDLLVLQQGLRDAQRKLQNSLASYIRYKQQEVDGLALQLNTGILQELQGKKQSLKNLSINAFSEMKRVFGFAAGLLREYQQELKYSLTQNIHTQQTWLKTQKQEIQHQVRSAKDFFQTQLQQAQQQLEQSLHEKQGDLRHELELLSSQLEGMSPGKLLGQGYTLTLKEGHIVHASENLAVGDEIETVFSEEKRVKSKVVK